MSEANLEVVRRFYKFWEDRDYSAIEDLLHPDVLVDVTRNVFNPGIHHGLDGFRQFVATVDEVWDELRFVPDQLIAEGDIVVVANDMRAKGRSSGVNVGMRLYGVCEFRDGKVARFTGGFRERSEVLKFAGLDEQQ
jgi:ketosteroid isomerase-like protein